MGQDVELWKRELKSAGWTPIRHDVWKAPCGCRYRGPYHAWTIMLTIKANDLECPNHKGCFPPCGLCYAGQCAAVPQSQSDATGEQN